MKKWRHREHKENIAAMLSRSSQKAWPEVKTKQSTFRVPNLQSDCLPQHTLLKFSLDVQGVRHKERKGKTENKWNRFKRQEK